MNPLPPCYRRAAGIRFTMWVIRRRLGESDRCRLIAVVDCRPGNVKFRCQVLGRSGVVDFDTVASQRLI
jgi:hypothetical protein